MQREPADSLCFIPARDSPFQLFLRQPRCFPSTQIPLSSVSLLKAREPVLCSRTEVIADQTDRLCYHSSHHSAAQMRGMDTLPLSLWMELLQGGRRCVFGRNHGSRFPPLVFASQAWVGNFAPSQYFHQGLWLLGAEPLTCPV